jgi:membrane-associated protease RseP (regulator of RpoE activity)
MGGELSFKTIIASGTNLKNYINESTSTFDKTANNGTGDLKFEILTTDEKEEKKISLSQAGVLTVKSYTAAKTHKIQYSYTATYNGAYSVPYKKTADITLQSVKVDNTGGSGTSYFISMTGMNSVSAKDDRPTRSGYKFIGYCSSKNDQGTKYINSAGARVNTSSFSSTIYAAWLKTSSVVSLTADNGNRDKTITDSDKYTEVIYPGMEREKLKAYGYTVLEITIKFDCKEKNDGYQDLWIYSHRDEQMGHTTFEHGSGYKDTNWGSHSVTYTLTLDNVQTDGSFWLRWGAHGNFGDDWVLGFTTITVTAQAASSSMLQFLNISALIGVNLAVFNLLPVPALDGSKVVFCLIEWIRKKPINRNVEAIIHLVGIIALFAFAILVDILQLF